MTNTTMPLIPVILCGGAGSRLWPVSRDLHPKPFIRLSDGQSLLQKAFLRGADLPGVTDIVTVTNRELFFKTEDEYREVNKRKTRVSFLLEPFGRNTAAAVAAASLHVRARYGDSANLLVLAADHLIADHAAFAAAVEAAQNLASEGKLVTFGIKPDAPETGYGYIEAEGHQVLRFVEKPGAEKAREYLESGRYFWNSGMFCFSAAAMIHEMDQHCPAILQAVQQCMARSRSAEGAGFSQIELDAELFDSVPEDSIDYAVMEKSASVAVVPCDIGWSDIGSWSALGELTQADAQGNRIEGEALLHDVTNTYIRGGDRVVGAVGVDNLVIIDTPDALLVADRRRAQDVKHLYAELKSQGHEAHKLHRTVHRPWGTYTVLEEGNRHKIKRIVVKPGASLSLQMHHHRSEHWIVVSGMAKVVNGEGEKLVATNESTYIPAGHPHRVSNPGVLDLVMIEVQSGDYLGEDDIVRFEDKYVLKKFGKYPAAFLDAVVSIASSKIHRKNIGFFTSWSDQGLGYQVRHYSHLLREAGFKTHVFSFLPYKAIGTEIKNQRDEGDWAVPRHADSVYYSYNDREHVPASEIVQFVRANRIGTLIYPEICWEVNWSTLGQISIPGLFVAGVPNLEIVRKGEAPRHGSALSLTMCPTRAVEQILYSHGVRNTRYIGHGFGRPLTDADVDKKVGRMQAREVTRFLHIGGHNPKSRKQTPYVIEAFLLALEQRNDIRLTVTVMDTQNIDFPRHENIEYVVGSLGHSEVMELYKACDVSIQVSSHEGVGMGFYESLAKGTPVISLDVPPHNEVVLHGLTGWLLKADPVPLPDNDDPVSRAARFDAQGLADLIASLEKAEIAAMIRSAAKVHRERFDDVSLKLRLIGALP